MKKRLIACALSILMITQMVVPVCASPAVSETVSENTTSVDGWGGSRKVDFDGSRIEEYDYLKDVTPIREDEIIESLDNYGENGTLSEGQNDWEAPAAYPISDKEGKTKQELIDELIDYADKNYPALRDQGKYGTCWAHSAVALGEISMIKQGKARAKDVDYSELALAYYITHNAPDKLGGFAGDSSYDGPSSNGTHHWANDGGNILYAAPFLAGWAGYTAEEDAPYSQMAEVVENGMSDEFAYKDVAHLENYYQSSPSDRDGIKKLIVENGAVSMSFCAASNNATFQKYYNLENNCYYYPEKIGTNHEVTIVGWDDNFSKDNFNEAVGKPESDGAWLVRNSWYDPYMDKYSYWGYFWISYYDANLSNFFSLKCARSDNYTNNYQYDGAVISSSFSKKNNTQAANVFKAKADENGEILRAVSFCTNGVTNINYTIKIYLNPKEGDPTSGIYLSDATTKGYTTYAGNYTIPLNQPVILGNEDVYAAVICLKKEGDNPGVRCEYSNISKPAWITSETAALENQSFIYNLNGDKKWGDLKQKYNANLRIKAFTDNIDPSNADHVKKYTIQYELDGGINDDNNPEYYRPCFPSISLGNPTREGKTFLGWYCDGRRITEIPSGSTGDMVLAAKWSSNNFSVRKSADTYEYTGCQIKPEIEVYSGTTLMTAGKDYTVSYRNNVNAYSLANKTDDSIRKNAPTLIVEGKGNYGGKVSVPFEITPASLENATVTVSTVRYNGNSYEPSLASNVKVVYNGKKLSLNKDYTVQCEDGDFTSVTTADIQHVLRIVAKEGGNFSGSVSAKLPIVDADKKFLSKVRITKIGNVKWDGNVYEPGTEGGPAIIARYGKKTFLTMGEDYLVKPIPGDDYSSAGRHTFTLVGVEGGKYVGEKTVSFNITGVPMKKVKISAPKSVSYTGEPIDLEALEGFSMSYTHREGKQKITDPLSLEDYDILYLTDRINAGKLKVKLVGKGRYQGSKVITIRIVPYR